MFKLALSLVFTAALVVPAMAQDNTMYPDVPENHWAYDAIARLRKDNILVPGLVPGDTSGKFLGRCYLTRYEFAVYIDRLYRVITSKFADMQAQIDALKTGDKTDLGPMQKQIDDLKAQIDGMKGWGADIQALQKLVNEFQKELNGLDLSVTEMKKGLADLESRVSALEARRPTFLITGDVDLAMLAGHSTDDNYGLMHDGTVVGYNRDSGRGGPVGLTKDVTMLHNLALHLTTTATEGPKVNATLIVGNVLDTLGSYAETASMRALHDPSHDETNFTDRNTDVYFQELNATWNASLIGQGVSAKLGRFGWQAGRYIFQRPAYTSQYYTDQYRDNGDYSLDGINLGFGFGKGSFNVVFGRQSNLKSVNGIDFNRFDVGANSNNPTGDPEYSARAQVDTTTGLTLNFPIGEVGKINLAYLLHDGFGAVGTGTSRVNRVQTYGVDAKFRFNNIDFGAAYSKGTTFDNNTARNDTDNAAWDVNAKFNIANVKLGAGYRRVEKNFASLADTGRFGTVWNPRNFEGFNVNASFMPSSNVELWGNGEFVKGISSSGGLGGSDTKVDTFTLGVNFKTSGMFDVGLSYEDVKFKTPGNMDARQKWYTLGIGYSMSANSKLSIKYIMSDINNGQGSSIGGFLGPTMSPPYGTTTTPGGDGIFKGGLLATQLSVKF